MPLARDSRTLGEFRDMPYVEPLARARKTRGVPVRAAAFADAVLAEIGKKLRHTSALETVAQNWLACVDAKFAQKCFAHCIKNDILFVSTTNAQVRQGLSFSEKKILSKIAKLDGCQNIKKIRFV